MQFSLNKPDLEKFIDDKVKTGDFPSRESVIELALTKMMQDEHLLTEEDAQAILQADQGIEAGDAVDFDTFANEMRTKYCISSSPS